MGSRGQGDVVTTVILISVVLVLAAIFVVIAMNNFARSGASTSLSLAESFLTNVADDVEASMYNPGTVLIYPLPSTQYGVYNVVNGYCNVTIVGPSVRFGYYSDAVIYGLPSNYYSMPSGYVKVVRGSLRNNAYSTTSIDTIVTNAAAPLISIVEYGGGKLGGYSYGMYAVLFPRVLVVNSTGVAYIYVPLFTVKGQGVRNSIVMNMTGITTYSINLTNPNVPVTTGLSIVNTCGNTRTSVMLPATTSMVRVIVINVNIYFR